MFRRQVVVLSLSLILVGCAGGTTGHNDSSPAEAAASTGGSHPADAAPASSVATDPHTPAEIPAETEPAPATTPAYRQTSAILGGARAHTAATGAENDGALPAAPAEDAEADAPSAPLPRFTNSVGMQFVLLPAGTFMMGSPPEEVGRTQFETRHEVTLTRPFHMGVTEVTQAQYEAVTGDNPSKFPGERTPAQNITYGDAVAFCEKLSEREGRTYRLPTEAEWEYACRAGTTTPFAFGKTISDQEVNFKATVAYGDAERGIYRARPVAADGMPPNPWGLISMHGNVQEWCSDWYDQDYYAKSPAVDPTGPGSGRMKALRGGSYLAYPQYCRSAHRFGASPNHKFMSIGFRVVCEFDAEIEE